MRTRRTIAFRFACPAIALAAALCAPCARGQEASLAEAIAGGRPILELRPRYNHIEESNKPLLTEGTTVRAIAGWRTAPWHDLRLTLEGIATGHLGEKKFNDVGAASASSPYPLLPDPEHSGVNQAFVDYDGFEATRVRVGRQVVRMDNQRFVSDNNFRQIPQLFDGVAITHAAFANAELYANYIWRQRNTSGNEASLNLTLLHAAWNPAPGHALAAYAYLHDQAQNGAFTGFADNSNRIAGVRAEGAIAVGAQGPLASLEIPYVAEWALQRPYSGGDDRIRARYWRLGAGASGRAWSLRYDYEVKGSNDGAYGLQTPLTDFYAFNGWTLHFFNTPRAGLRDRWATARLAWGPLVFYGEEHRFKSDFGALDYGRETDLGLTWLPLENLSIRLQNGRYRPGGSQPPQPKVTKTWVTLTYTY